MQIEAGILCTRQRPVVLFPRDISSHDEDLHRFSESWTFIISEYATTLLQNAAACQNVWSFTWWCSHDIDPAMKGFLGLEYTLGVLDQQNRVKPLGRTLSKLAEEWRKNPPAVISRPIALVIPDKGLSKSGDVADWSIAKQYMDLVSRGTRPAIVLESRVGDKAYLKNRGIEELVKAVVR